MNKKILLGVALLTSPLLLTGCGKKQTLECTMEQSTSGITGSVVSTVVYKGKTMTEGKIVYDFDYSGIISSDSQLEILKSQKYCDNMVPAMREADPDLVDGIKDCNEKWNGKKLVVTINLDAKALSKKDNFKGIDKAKEEFEAGDTMKCVIK